MEPAVSNDPLIDKGHKRRVMQNEHNQERVRFARGSLKPITSTENEGLAIHLPM
jgi:hypothetical protein